MTKPGGHVGWSIVSQLEQPEMSLTGQLTRGMRITFKTDLGNTGSIWVPDTVYPNTTEVKRLIQDAVDQVTAVQRLQG